MNGQADTVLPRCFEDMWNQGREAAIDKLMTDETALRGLEEVIRGPAAFKPVFEKFRTGLPDLQPNEENAA